MNGEKTEAENYADNPSILRRLLEEGRVSSNCIQSVVHRVEEARRSEEKYNDTLKEVGLVLNFDSTIFDDGIYIVILELTNF